MTKICCSTGKAKITYNSPSSKGIKYKIGLKWNFISGDNLTPDCEAIGYRLAWKDCDQQNRVAGFDEPIRIIRIFNTGAQGEGWYIEVWRKHTQQVSYIYSYCNRLSGVGPQNVRVENIESYRFSIKDANQNILVDLSGLSKCPDVQQAGCIFDPKNEKTLIVELPQKMIPWIAVPTSWYDAITKKPYITLDSCLQTYTTDTAIEIWLQYQAPGIALAFDPLNITGFNKLIKSIPLVEGCPPPKGKISCCDSPDGKNKKCPPETDCQIECDGFLCCYSKGKLIQSIKL